MNVLEGIAAGFGLICVTLTVRQSLWCWSTGLVQVFLYIFVFYEAKLYSDVGLHVIYVILNIYGWWHWWRGGTQTAPLPVRQMSRREALGWAITAIAGTSLLGFAMSQTDAALPYWDSAIAVMSLIAQYLLARKVLENWLMWVAVDALAVGVYSFRDLYLTAGLYAVFFVLASMGYVAWRRTLPRSAPG